jgi:SAM-dependent methyltransferase
MAVEGPERPESSAHTPEPPGVQLGRGFYADEGGWRWMSHIGEIHVDRKYLPAKVCFVLSCVRELNYGRAPFEVTIRTTFEKSTRVTFQDSDHSEFVELLIESTDADVLIFLESSQIFVPAELGLSGDTRSLSVRLSHLTLQTAALRACPVCGGRDSVDAGASRRLGQLPITAGHVSGSGLYTYDLVECIGCELIYISPLPPRNVFDSLYVLNQQFAGPVYRGPRTWLVRAYYWRRFRSLLKQYPSELQPIRILEVGSGLSWMCRTAKRFDPHAVTVAQDVSPEASQSCPWVDHFVVGDLAENLDLILKHGPFHVISMTHVIEHVPDPVSTLMLCSGLLDRTGVLFVTTPHRPKQWNASSPIHFWRAWKYSHVPAHLQDFNRNSLGCCGALAKLRLAFYEERQETLEARLTLGDNPDPRLK